MLSDGAVSKACVPRDGAMTGPASASIVRTICQDQQHGFPRTSKVQFSGTRKVEIAHGATSSPQSSPSRSSNTRRASRSFRHAGGRSRISARSPRSSSGSKTGPPQSDSRKRWCAATVTRRGPQGGVDAAAVLCECRADSETASLAARPCLAAGAGRCVSGGLMPTSFPAGGPAFHEPAEAIVGEQPAAFEFPSLPQRCGADFTCLGETVEGGPAQGEDRAGGIGVDPLGAVLLAWWWWRERFHAT